MIGKKIFSILAFLLLIGTIQYTTQAMNLKSTKISTSQKSLLLVKNEKVSYWGVIIGIFEYENGAQLSSKAVRDMYSAMLSSKNWNEDNLKFITNEKATKEGIKSAIKWLANVSDEDDFVFFYYNGHCGQFPDDDGDEKDGKDEALIPYEYNESTKSPIARDDELDQWFDLVKAKGICLIFDTCHSGGLVENDNDYLSMKNTAKHNLIKEFVCDLESKDRVIIVSSPEAFLTYVHQGLGGTLTIGLSIGLRGFADFNMDRQCSAEEAFRFVKMFQILLIAGGIGLSIAMGLIDPTLILCIPVAWLIVEIITYLNHHSFVLSFALMYDGYEGQLPILEL